MDNNNPADATINNNNNSLLPNYVINLVNDIAKKEGFQNYRLEEYTGSSLGDGFNGIIYGIQIIGKCKLNPTNNNNNKIQLTRSGDDHNNHHTLSLICKMPPTNPARRQQFNSIAIFMRERYMYETILPIFNQFQMEKQLEIEHQFVAYPKCYATICNEQDDQFVIVLEDLRASGGYEMWNKFKSVDFEHVRMLMEQLGKFHAVSFALRDQRPAIFRQFHELEDLFMIQMKMNGDIMKALFSGAIDKAVTTLKPHEEYKIEKMIELKEKSTQVLLDCLTADIAEPFSVVNHGDCWNNNMMYRYDGTSSPQNISLIDWQLSRFGSPALDLVYYLFTSTDSTLRNEYYDRLIKIYYKNLAKTLERLGSNPEKLFTFNDLQEQLRRFGKYALIIAPLLIQVVTANPNDIPDMDKISNEMQNNTGNIVNILNVTNASYEERMSGVIRDIIRLGYY